MVLPVASCESATTEERSNAPGLKIPDPEESLVTGDKARSVQTVVLFAVLAALVEKR